MDILLSSLVAGILLGMVLAIVALGLTIIFGVMDIVNFAHGEFLMIGMYTGLLAAQATGIDPLLTLPLAVRLPCIDNPPISVNCPTKRCVWARSASML